MLLKWTILICSASFALSSCTGASGHDMDLLTHSPWKYEKAAFDSDDEDGTSFNALDPRIIGFEKDYSIVFRKDGTGAMKDGRTKTRHHPGPDSLPFLWSFKNNDSLLYFQDQYYRVQTLNNDRLIIYADHKLGRVNSRYTVVLKH